MFKVVTLEVIVQEGVMIGNLMLGIIATMDGQCMWGSSINVTPDFSG